MSIRLNLRNSYNLIKRIIRFRHTFTFLYRVIYLNTVIFWFDKESPRKGNIKLQGFHFDRISEKSIKAIKNHYETAKIKNNLNAEKLYEAFYEIFNKFKKVIIEYIGEEARLDGIKIIKTSIQDSKKNISSNWHTDNVGIRLKLFICFEGDGSQPTFIINNKNNNNLLKKIFKDYIFEVKRWIGFDNKIKSNEQISLKHLTGSAYIFDTNNLHRGSYEEATAERKVLVFEFSTFKKHVHLKNSPIGTIKNYNDFTISKEFIDIDSFNFFLDPRRLIENNKYFRYSQSCKLL